MKRNVLRKFKKILGRFKEKLKDFNYSYGRYVFLVVGILVTTILYIRFPNNEGNTTKAEEKVITKIYHVNREKVKTSQIGYIEKKIDMSNNEVNTVKAEEKVIKIYLANREEAENSQVGYIEKEIDTSKEYFSGMSARIAYLDEPYIVQATISENEAVLAEEDDILLLEKTVYAEARGEPEDGQIGVINVIMNRVEAPEEVYPNSVHDVVFDRRFNTIQFECAICTECQKNGTICETCKRCNVIWAGSRIVTKDDITENLEDAVMKALSGENTVGDRTNFHRYVEGVCNHENQKVIGNHVFY